MSRKIERFQGESFKEYNYTADNIYIVQIFYLDFNKNIVKNKKNKSSCRIVKFVARNIVLLVIWYYVVLYIDSKKLY